ncbi:MAG: hypothetical protein R3B70_20375 [Polyangiaceae bacterium]
MTFYGRTSAEMREMALHWYLEPMARHIFAADKSVQSVTLAIAQYWADNANDEVHLELIPAAARDPRWSEIASDPWRWGQGSSERLALLESASLALFGRRYSGYTSTRAIIAFAACCKEGVTQHDEYIDRFTPYAIARRGAKNKHYPEARPVDIEVVGKVLRPEAENRWLVGYDAVYAREQDPAGAPEPGLRQLSREEIDIALELLSEAGDWQSVVGELLRAAAHAVNAPSEEARWRLRYALESVEYVAASVGLMEAPPSTPDKDG